MDQVILLSERFLAERFCLAWPSFISAALSRRLCGSAEADTASCCDWTIVPGPFEGTSRSRRDAGAGEHHDLRGNPAITMDFIWAKQKSAMGLA
jgi:hypothetical protein